MSGGLRQRATIAVALSCRPSLLLADEPTTALDATVQIQVLILLRKLQAELGMSVIIVTHDLGVAAQIADKVAVMYAGRIVEYGNARDVLLNPSHPYTIGLLSLDRARPEPRSRYRGDPRQPAGPAPARARLQLSPALQVRHGGVRRRTAAAARHADREPRLLLCAAAIADARARVAPLPSPG